MANLDHARYMDLALDAARNSPPSADKFCVGAVLVNGDTGDVLSTGYSLECGRLPETDPDPGSTHAEQCCFIKMGIKHHDADQRISELLPANTALYTTMEPCNKRLSGRTTCVDRILALRDILKTVYVGTGEPDVFIKEFKGEEILEAHGVKVVYPLKSWKNKILAVSLAGHSEESRARYMGVN